MTKKQLEKAVKGLFAKERHIGGEAANRIATSVLADGLLSRTEKRFLRGLLRYKRMDQTAQTVLQRVVSKGA